ncbi:unnamed protein product [Caenorhabditis bovis]|uniref:Papilin n=1 Tax=Caenorhabditis bovis TaxID=2654633 RepID=A0A8S1E0B9_9PELO|nr:unnamed protein product [Caenorhabditis bovis]
MFKNRQTRWLQEFCVEACDRACGRFRSSDVCSQPKETGNCRLAVPRWYFDKQLRQCKMMMWSGCGGNGNSFSSKSDCETLCRAESSWNEPDADICQLPRSSGPCTDSISMWYYDEPSSECKQFTYGGCRGNKNRFVTRQQCEQRCKPVNGKKPAIQSDVVCRLPFETGPCRMRLQKYFYDPYIQKCQVFYYGGCEGNANRFDTELECYKLCSSIKSEPKENIAQLSHQSTPVIYVVDKGPILTGTTFRIRCNSYGVFPVTWYKNGGLLQFGSRITEENDDTLEFVDALSSDAGVYTCVAGHDSQMSDGVEVVIKRAPTTTTKMTPRPKTTTMTTTSAPTTHRKPIVDACVDTGTAGTCNLIVRNGLCTKKRYGSFCCRTCSKNNFKF